jgi:hypothetical protein
MLHIFAVCSYNVHFVFKVLTCFKSCTLEVIQEDSNVWSFDFRILALAKASAKGISDKDIQNEIPELRPDQRASIINKLLAQVI